MADSDTSIGWVQALLGRSDPHPVLRSNAAGSSGWLLLCDHAGNDVPLALGDLGLDRSDLDDHIGIDIGAWNVTLLLSGDLDAEAIGQRYSRLVIDNNRRPGVPSSIPAISDRRTVPANQDLSDGQAQSRVNEIFLPYHELISERIAARQPTALCAVHSFTRQLADQRRSVDIGVIHGKGSGLADSLLAGLKAATELNVQRNEPYRIDFAGDYTLPVHGEAAGIPFVELEICQDLICNPNGQERIASLLAPALRATLQEIRL